MKKFFFITKSDKNRIEYLILENFSKSINANLFDYDSTIFQVSKFHHHIHLLFKTSKNDILIFHTPFVYFSLIILILKILGRKSLGIIWDSYPVTINKKRYDTRFTRRIADFLENISLNSLSTKIIPTLDFSSVSESCIVVKFWPSLNLKKIEDLCTEKPSEKTHFKIIFSGQINKTRGLVYAYQRLKEIISTEFTLFIASNDPLPSELSTNYNIKYLGFLDKKTLKKKMLTCDFGLVSLDPGFDGPAFPSKTFEYIESGLPILYSGPNLSSFTNTLISSGLGINLSQTSVLDDYVLAALKSNYLKKAFIFQEMNCLDDEEILYFKNTLERL